MKKIFKFMAIAVLVTNCFYISNVNALTLTKVESQEYITSAVPITTIRKVLKYAYKILKVGDYFGSGMNVSRYPNSYLEGADVDSFSTGAINFNDKLGSGLGSTVFKEILATQSGQKVRMIGINQQTFVGKMAFQIWKNGTLIANPSAKNPYEIYEKSLSSGTHQCAYIVTAKETWSGFTAFYHYAAGNNTPTSIANPLGENLLTNQNSADSINISQKDSYLVVKRTNTPSMRILSKKEHINFADLRREFFDVESGMFVHQSINYNIGDEIKVSDTIVDMEYDFRQDATSLYFNSGEDILESIAFKGDITNKYEVGDIINLKFEVLPMFEDSTEYQILDHNYYHQNNNQAPSIDDYLYVDDSM